MPAYSQRALVIKEIVIDVAPKTAPVMGLAIEKTALVKAVMPADPAIEATAPRAFPQIDLVKWHVSS